MGAGPASTESSMEARIARLESEESIASAKIWALALYIAFGATVLGTMARGFNWL